MSLPKRDSLTSPDNPVHQRLENQVESISDTLEAIDSYLYHAKYNAKQMHKFFLLIASRARICADMVKTD